VDLGEIAPQIIAKRFALRAGGDHILGSPERRAKISRGRAARHHQAGVGQHYREHRLRVALLFDPGELGEAQGGIDARAHLRAGNDNPARLLDETHIPRALHSDRRTVTLFAHQHPRKPHRPLG
jgi:hypothetical protein